MAFQTLREQSNLNPRLDAAIDDLLARKRASNETDAAAPIPLISEFIESELARQATTQQGRRECLPDIEPLNRYFRWLIQRHGGPGSDPTTSSTAEPMTHQ